MADWKDILSGSDRQLSEEDLLKLFDDHTTARERHELEKKISKDPFESDAMQGLSQMHNKENLEKHVSQLNQKLKQITARKPRKEKRKINVFEWIIAVIILLLFICIAGYFIVNLLGKSHLHTEIMSFAKNAFIYL